MVCRKKESCHPHVYPPVIVEAASLSCTLAGSRMATGINRLLVMLTPGGDRDLVGEASSSPPADLAHSRRCRTETTPLRIARFPAGQHRTGEAPRQG